ncbi:MAG: N-acetyl-gamma-glutamyl-phosphate reductase [Chloroflexi bacterium]|nr:N-acetyl-gamma-glutamyl-phosphate reductase [Chloroflexota bacterium]MDA1239733.1 N-acetyl-gamma-glutamyl-phosphate reductase [Chloroflexota bacterium]
MSGKIRAQLIGATGYGGLGILELLLAHPNFEISTLVARDDAGRRIDEVYPHLAGRCELVVQGPDAVEAGADSDVVIFATPDRVSQQYAESLTARGIRFIDYSGDFRFTSTEDYARYADRHPSIKENTHDAPSLLGRNAFGVSELNAEAIATAPIVGNPGCFAVGIILGLAPLYRDGLVEGGLVAVDGLTGSSGAGKKPAPLQHFSHLNDNVVPYRMLNHQHVVEAEMTLGRIGASSGATVDFIPHLLGTTRGILNTMHLTLTKSMTREALLGLFREMYAGHPFVRVLDTPPTLKGPVGSNYLDLSAFVAEGGKRAVVMTSIDNLMKGQSGSAMQNLNIMFGLPQTAGLERGPLYP